MSAALNDHRPVSPDLAADRPRPGWLVVATLSLALGGMSGAAFGDEPARDTGVEVGVGADADVDADADAEFGSEAGKPAVGEAAAATVVAPDAATVIAPAGATVIAPRATTVIAPGATTVFAAGAPGALADPVVAPAALSPVPPAVPPPAPRAPARVDDDTGARSCPIARARPAGATGCSGRWNSHRSKKRWWRASHHSGTWSRQRVGIGLTRAHLESGDAELDERGLLARVRLSRRLVAEVEVGKIGRRGHDDAGPEAKRWGDHDDRGDHDEFTVRTGAALMVDLRPHGRLSPFLSVGGGVTSLAQRGEDPRVTHRYGELGAGLGLRLGKRIRLEADVRVGENRPHAGRDAGKDAPDPAAVVMPAGDARYARARFNAFLYF